MRRISGKLSLIVTIIATLMAFYNVYALLFTLYDIVAHMAINLAFVLPLSFILYPASSKNFSRVPWYDYILAFISTIPPAILYLNHSEWVYGRYWFVTPFPLNQLILGVIFMICIIEATRRCIGKMMMLLVIFFILFLYAGPYLPPPFTHRGLSWTKIVELNYVTTHGTFSVTLMIMTTYVIAFTILGAMFTGAGIGGFFIDLSKALVGKRTAGPAKVSVIASSLFGTVSGSAVANVFGTGVVTIPTMKRLGFPPDFAGAVEAVSSTGGQIMPPIMGAAAFIMAEMLDVPYARIMVAAIVPSLIYYFCVYVQIHYFGLKHGFKSIPKAEIPNLKMLLVKNGYMLTPLAIMVYIIVVMAWHPVTAALISMFITIGLSFVRRETWLTPRRLINAFSEGAINAVSIIVVGAAAGLIVGSVTYSGIANMLGSIIYEFSFGVPIIAFIYVALFTTIMGMGVPTTAAYVLTAALAVPALSLFKDVIIPAAHFFVFYYACLSAITPPVALAAYAAASLAGGNMFKVGLLAMRLGVSGFIVPFVFLMRPELLIGLVGSTTLAETLVMVIFAFIGTYFLALAMEGFIKTRIKVLERIALIIAGLFLYLPIFLYNLIGIVLGIAILSSHYYKAKK